MRLTKDLINKPFNEQNEVGVITQYFCDDLLDAFFSVLNEIDLTQLSTETQNKVFYILNNFDDEEEDETTNETVEMPVQEISVVKKKIPPQEKMLHHQYYLKHKNKIQQAMKKYRNTAQYKQWQKKYERMKKQGKTATGKKLTQYV